MPSSHVSPSDDELWELVRSGDADAFGLLFERRAVEIYNYCFRATGDWAAAEDLLSLTFLEAWRRRGKELPAGAFRPWLYGIATNVLRNRRRSERRFAAALKRVPVPLPEPEFAGAADSRLDDERQMQGAHAVLAELRPHEREAFLLCAYMGLSYADAAMALSVPIGTVRSRVARARRHIEELESRNPHTEDTETRIEEAFGR